MNEKTLKALVEAGAVKCVRVVADGSRFHVEVDTPTATHVAHTGKGQPGTWASLDATARWLRALGIGSVQVDVSKWQPGQRSLKI